MPRSPLNSSKTAAAPDEKPTAADEAPRTLSGWLLAHMRYPAIAVALIGVLSTVFAAPISEWVKSLTGNGAATTSSGDRLIAFMKKNQLCTQLGGIDFEAPGGVKIQATICESGDIYLAFYFMKDGKAATKYGGIFLHETLSDGAAGIVVAGGTVGLPGPDLRRSVFDIIGTAVASEVSGPGARVKGADGFLTVGGPGAVQCQVFPGNATIVRIIDTGGGCFKEVIDANTGFVVNSFPVPCGSPC